MSRSRPLNFGDLSVELFEVDPDTILLKSKQSLHSYPTTILDRLIYWAEKTPDSLFLAQRNSLKPDSWEKLNYRQTLIQVRTLASSLSKFPLSENRPVAVLSGNSIEHALLAFAAMYIGVPYAPISPQYSLVARVSKDYAKLKHVLQLITPGLIFADHLGTYKDAIQQSAPADSIILSCVDELDEAFRHRFSCHSFSEFAQNENPEIADTLHDSVTPDTIAKFLFSSGSTGMPKAVINTHKMLAANQQMIVQAYPFLRQAPVLVDWLPWNHTFGGNHNLGIALYNGGSYYIDEGKPTHHHFEHTVCNLEEISPTAYFNVPKGYQLLVKQLKENSTLRTTFFKHLKMLFYAGAGISQTVWNALDELAIQTCGESIKILTGLGSTETGPSALFTTHQPGFAGLIGLPLPGMQTKLKRVQDKFEIRFRGDNVSPGYWRAPELTSCAFDEEGYYKTGDAVKFADARDPQKGLQFDGRISEDFKLDSGTWVSAGTLKARFLDHFGSLVKDAVIIGRDKPSIAALVFPDFDYCRKFLENGETAFLYDDDNEKLLNNPVLREHFQSLLITLSKQSTGSSNRIDRLIIETHPPSVEKYEITDKGSLNSNAIQKNRAHLIEMLYENPLKAKAIFLDNPFVSNSA